MAGENIKETALPADTGRTDASAEKAAGSVEYLISSILEQIAAVQRDTAYIHKALDSLLTLMSERPQVAAGSPMYTDPAAAAAEAVGRIVASRETTNQQLLKIYGNTLFQLQGLLEPDLPGPD